MGPTEGRRRLLVVDDDPVNRRALKRAFQAEYTVYEAADGTEALELARALRPDVILSDQRMPNMSGIELLAKLKDEQPHSVRVLITGHHDYSTVVDAVNAAGVHHYVEKPFHTTDLQGVVAALVRAEELRVEREQLTEKLAQANRELADRGQQLERLVAERTKDLTEANHQLEIANQRLRELTIRDELTGLFNRRLLFEQLELEVQRSRRYGREFSLLFMDVDHFKAINDEFGHAIGDQVLREIAACLHSVGEGLRRSDFVARYGGEEFCVLLPETAHAGALIKAERVREAVESRPIRASESGGLIHVTVSIGVASFPIHGQSVDQIIGAADAAQYSAKRAGKNRVHAPSV